MNLGDGWTNNEAEIWALLSALRQLLDLQTSGVPHLQGNIRVFGDSQLVIKWLLGLFKKANKASLYRCVEEIKQMIRKQAWPCTFRNIPRVLNSAADDMCRRARELPETDRIVFTDDSEELQSCPTVDLDAIYTQQEAALGGQRASFISPEVLGDDQMAAAGKPCHHCKSL